MSCDTHDRSCLVYLSEEYSSKVSKGFENYFSRYRAEKLGHMDGQADRQADRRRQRQYASVLGPSGKYNRNKIIIKGTR